MQPVVAVRSGTVAAALFTAVVCGALPGCAAAYGEDDAPAEGKAALGSTGACARATVRTTDTFERAKPAEQGWSKGRVSDTLPTIKTPNARTTAVLTSRVEASKDEDGKSTSYIEREVPTTGCVAAEFSVVFSEAAPFPDDAWTYFFWIDGSSDMNISLFRQGNIVRLAAQRGGTELSRIDVDVEPRHWTTIKVEAELDSDRPTMAITVGDHETKRAVLAEPLEPPYFVSFGTWSRGQVPTHEFSYDDVKLWY